MKILAIDTETGGVDPKTSSLLTGYFAVLDENFNCVAELDLTIKPEKDEFFKIQGAALEINKINVLDIYKNGIRRTEAGSQLLDFVYKHSDGGKDLLVPLGHNVAFDLRYIFEHLIPKETWDKYVSYRTLDTQVIAQFLAYKGVLPRELSGSLKSLAKHFNIEVGNKLHNARFDTVVTTLVFQNLIKL